MFCALLPQEEQATLLATVGRHEAALRARDAAVAAAEAAAADAQADATAAQAAHAAAVAQASEAITALSQERSRAGALATALAEAAAAAGQASDAAGSAEAALRAAGQGLARELQEARDAHSAYVADVTLAQKRSNDRLAEALAELKACKEVRVVERLGRRGLEGVLRGRR